MCKKTQITCKKLNKKYKNFINKNYSNLRTETESVRREIETEKIRASSLEQVIDHKEKLLEEYRQRLSEVDSRFAFTRFVFTW